MERLLLPGGVSAVGLRCDFRLSTGRDSGEQPGPGAEAGDARARRVFTAYRPLTFLVPPQALIDGRVVVVEGDRVRSRLVQAGILTEEAEEVLSGVVSGELVVTSGRKGLSDGAQVTYQKP